MTTVARVASVARVGGGDVLPARAPNSAVKAGHGIDTRSASIDLATVNGATPAASSAGATAAPALIDRVMAASVRNGELLPRAAGRNASAGSRESATGAEERNDGAGARAMLAEAITARSEAGFVSPADATVRSDAAERIARILQARDTAAERPLSSVVLRLDHPEGGEDRIRVDLRGQSVATTLDMHDAASADRLGAHVQELARALERRGLDPEALTVRTGRGADPVVGGGLGANADRDAVRSTSSSGAGSGAFTGRDPRNPARGDDQRQGDPSRQKGRRGARGES
jgi:hypothetical protein